MSSTRRAKTGEALAALSFVLPGVSVISICVFIPMAIALVLSFTHCSQFLSVRWAGFSNYARLFSDPKASGAIANTLLYTITSVPATLVCSLAVALILNREFPGIRFIRSVYFVPVAVSGVVTASIFRFLFDPTNGPLNAVLGVLGFEPVAWLGDPQYAMGAIIFMSLWKGTAFFAIILLAALQHVPRELLEAATVDGAGPIARFFHVTLPSIRGTVITVVMLSSIGAFRVFEPMFVLTRGGPADSTQTVALLAYNAAFQDGEIGYANAIGFALLVVILGVTWVLNTFGEERQ